MSNLNTQFLSNPYTLEVQPDEILKDSFKKLGSKNIPEVDIESEDVKREFLKYHYLILNKLYFDKNDLEYTQSVLNNKTKNAIKYSRKSILWLLSKNRRVKMEESLSSLGKKEINEKLISYPLYFMWNYINENLDELKTWNDKQIEFAEKFWLSHLQDVRSIVEVLWFNDILNWSTVNLPVLTFKWLKVELESAEASWVLWSINWNSLLLSFSTSLKVENFENLYYWVVALWYKEKMNVNNVKMPTMRMNRILRYVKNRFWKPNSDIVWDNVINFVITEEWVQKIYEDNLHMFADKNNLTNSKIAQIKSNIRSALRWFGYRLEIDRDRLKN